MISRTFLSFGDEYRVFYPSSDQVEKKEYPEASKYTFLDFLVNNDHYRLFQKLYQAINTNTSMPHTISCQKLPSSMEVEERKAMKVNERNLDCISI